VSPPGDEESVTLVYGIIDAQPIPRPRLRLGLGMTSCECHSEGRSPEESVTRIDRTDFVKGGGLDHNRFRILVAPVIHVGSSE
jgi:hypothetical protein